MIKGGIERCWKEESSGYDSIGNGRRGDKKKLQHLDLSIWGDKERKVSNASLTQWPCSSQVQPLTSSATRTQSASAHRLREGKPPCPLQAPHTGLAPRPLTNCLLLSPSLPGPDTLIASCSSTHQAHACPRRSLCKRMRQVVTPGNAQT